MVKRMIKEYARLEVVDPSFVGEYQHERVEDGSVVYYLLLFALQVNPHQALHIFVFFVTLILIS
jgi:hypothetical protein